MHVLYKVSRACRGISTCTYFKVQLKVDKVRIKVREGDKHVHVLQNVLKDGFIDPLYGAYFERPKGEG